MVVVLTTETGRFKCVVAEIFSGDDGLRAVVLIELGGGRLRRAGFFCWDLYDRCERAGVGACDPGGDGMGFGVGYKDEDGFGLAVSGTG